MRRRVVGVVAAVIAVAVVVAWWQRGGSADDVAARRGGAGTGSAEEPGRARGMGVATEDVRPGSIGGTVVRKSDGAPVAGAVIALASAHSELRAPALDDETVVVTSDAKGAWTARPLLAGTYAVSATAPGYTSATASGIALAAGEQRTGVALVLEAGNPTLRGTVADIGGGPIAGARITAHRTD